MGRTKYTYNIAGLLTAMVLSEVVFWILYYLISSSLGIFGSHGSEKLLYKHPEALKALFIVIPIAGVFIYNFVRHNRKAGKVSDHVLRSYMSPVSGKYLFMKYLLFRTAFVFLVLTMAQPVFGKKKVSGTTDSLELVVCLDVSNSMNTKDISDEISRLEISKRALVQLLNNLHGERIGICLFANNAFVQLPVTRDYGAAKLFINEIETDMISSQGTNIKAALNTAIKMFSKDHTAKGIILVTDGENHESDPTEVLAKIKSEKIQFSVLGIGTSKGGLVPKNPRRPELGYKTSSTGRSVVSKMNPSFIKKIASKGGGYANFSSSEFPDLSALLTQINQMKRAKIDNLEFDIKEERYQFTLAIAIFFWLLYILWSKNYKRLFQSSEIK
jgi:Ca-activated chloride channel family protein